MRRPLQRPFPEATSQSDHANLLKVSACLAAGGSVLLFLKLELFTSKSGWDGVGQAFGWGLIAFIWVFYLLYAIVTSVICWIREPSTTYEVVLYHVLSLLGVPAVLAGLMFLVRKLG